MFNLGVGFGLVKQLTDNNRNNISQRRFKRFLNSYQSNQLSHLLLLNSIQ
jgi:hypothetical protein